MSAGLPVRERVEGVSLSGRKDTHIHIPTIGMSGDLSTETGVGVS